MVPCYYFKTMTSQDILESVVKEYYDYKQTSPYISEDETISKDVFERLEYQAFLFAWQTGRTKMWKDHIAEASIYQAEIKKQIDKNNASLWTKLKSWWSDKF